MSAHLEIRGSHVTGLLVQGKRVKVDIDGYVHRWEETGLGHHGDGRAVPVVLEILGRVCRVPSALPARIDVGAVVGTSERHDNLVPLPLALPGAVTVLLKIANGELLEIEGHDLTVQPLAEGRCVDALSGGCGTMP